MIWARKWAMKNFDTAFWINFMEYKITYFKPIPSCYDVSNDMVSKRASQKNLRSNPKPALLPRPKRKSNVCSEAKEVL